MDPTSPVSHLFQNIILDSRWIFDFWMSLWNPYTFTETIAIQICPSLLWTKKRLLLGEYVDKMHVLVFQRTIFFWRSITFLFIGYFQRPPRSGVISQRFEHGGEWFYRSVDHFSTWCCLKGMWTVEKSTKNELCDIPHCCYSYLVTKLRQCSFSMNCEFYCGYSIRFSNITKKVMLCFTGCLTCEPIDMSWIHARYCPCSCMSVPRCLWGISWFDSL